ncbi:GcvT family protein [Benzoatithermus flavus]|uniref:FAD-dependent oxidoreductase n=1 Tax=Benzoatithermus flavus TaxID=3108223 RepID=A0ABU8XSG2_9PROT
MTRTARVVVIGGGAVGTSALWHLAMRGWTDCLLLEMNELTAGSTWHAAGNCPTFSGSWTLMRMQAYGAKLYRRLSAELEGGIGYHGTGSLRLAHHRERMDEFRHVLAMAHAQGLPYELLGPAEARARYPFLELHDLEGALWDPLDGDVDPSQLTQAYARMAREAGCRIERFTRVVSLERSSGGEWLVGTDKGETIRAEIVVNAAGYRAGEIMALVGRHLPIVAMQHQYLVTEDILALAERGASKLPLLRDPDTSYYLRQERHGFILGPYEWDCRAEWVNGLPEDFAYQLWPDDLGRLERYIEDACGRVPILAEGGVKRVVNGPIPYAPDGNPYIGPVHGLTNFYQCCCFSFGIAQSGGAGKFLSEWVVDGEPEWDGWVFDPRRYTGYATTSYTVAKAVELYQNEYAIGFPFEERPAGRPARTTPLYPVLKAKGARFGARNGWERAVFFDPEGRIEQPSLTLRRERNWNPLVAQEVRAVREAVGVIDLGGFSKFLVEGAGAEAMLDRVLCSRLPKPGRIALCYALDERGGVVSEFTVTRLAHERFYLVSASTAEWHDEDLLRAAMPDDDSVRLETLHGRLGTLVVAGPKARDALAKITPADLSNAAFPWLTGREIELGSGRALALRINYVGELGWELHLPMEELLPAYERIMAAGTGYGIRDVGIYAVESMRLDKCYRSWKQDLEIGFTALEAGLDRFVDLEKPDFIGKAALVAQRERGVGQRLVPLTLDDAGEYDAPFCAPVHENGERVGLVTSGFWSFTLDRSIALAYVRSDLARPGQKVAVEIYGRMTPATVCEEPLYDPGNARLKA